MKGLVMVGLAVIVLIGILVSSFFRRSDNAEQRIIHASTQPAIHPDYLARKAEEERTRLAQKRALEERRRQQAERLRRQAEKQRLEALMARRSSDPRASSRFSTLSPQLSSSGGPQTSQAHGATEGARDVDAQLSEALARAALDHAYSDEARRDQAVSVPDPKHAVRPRHARTHRPRGVYLRAGTALPAVLLTRVITERPGPVQAIITHDIFATGAARQVLIPAGTRVLGFVDTQPSAGQRAIDVAWNRLIYDDGTTLLLEDASTGRGDGAAGLRGQVDNHWPSFYTHAFLTSVTGAVAQLSQRRRSTGDNSGSSGEDAASALGRNLSDVTREVARRNLERPPTIEIAPGTRLAITLLEDLVFSPAADSERAHPS